MLIRKLWVPVALLALGATSLDTRAQTPPIAQLQYSADIGANIHVELPADMYFLSKNLIFCYLFNTITYIVLFLIQIYRIYKLTAIFVILFL